MHNAAKLLLLVGGAMSAMAARANLATFDNVSDGTDLTAYQEDGMWITVNNIAFTSFDPTHGHGGGFSGGFHYPNSGANGATSISMVNGSVMSSVSFSLGDGWGGTDTHYHFWAYSGGNIIDNGSGTFFSGNTFTYNGSFDMFRIGAYSQGDEVNATPDTFQAVALDNVSTVVPEPTTMAVLGIGAAALIRRRNRK